MSAELTVAPLAELRRRRSAKWRSYPADVLPLTVAEMDFALAPPISTALRAAIDASDSGYSAAVPGLGEAYAGFAAHPAVYVLCNPHNPVGRVHNRDELAALVRLARHYHVTIVSDEIHAPLVLPGATYTPLLTVPGAAEVAISVVSASKAWNLAGLKCAAVVSGSAAMARVVDRFPPDARWRTGHLGVIASIAAFTDGEPWLEQLLHTLDARRTHLGDLLRTRLPMVAWHPPQATYLAWLDCTKLGRDDEPRELFLGRGNVALEPGLRFGPAGAGYVRLNFGTGPEILEEATARMATAVGR
jgi:cystathionine beta-lyase